MECKFAYDMDGVICEAPKENEKSFFKMNGVERKERNAYLRHHYAYAAPLHIPAEESLIIITARKFHKPVQNFTRFWTTKHLRGKEIQIHFLREARTIKNVAKFKNRVIAELGITDFVEDNLRVLKEMKKQGTTALRLHYFENGAMRDITSEL